MSRRAGGVLALIAAALLFVSVVTPVLFALDLREPASWWSGKPTIDNRPSHLFKLNIGLIQSAGCHVNRHGGEVRECATDEEARRGSCGCQPIPLGTGFRIAKYTTFGLGFALFALTLATGLAQLVGSRSRTRFGKLVLVTVTASAIATIVLLVMGPTVKGVEIDAVPFGTGLYLFFGGAALAITSALLALRPDRAAAAVRASVPVRSSAPALRPSQPAVAPGAAPPPAAPAFDVGALFGDNAVRPSAPGPEPRPSRPLPPSPGGVLPGPAGPLAPPPPQQPLFASAPQLRPLYEASGSPIAPIRPPLPPSPPTPVPMSVIDALTGNAATPPPRAAPPPTSPPPVPPVPARSKTLPPPTRGKPASIVPPMIPPPPRATPPPPSKNPTIISTSVPPPRDLLSPLPSRPGAPPLPGRPSPAPASFVLPTRPMPDLDDDGDNQATADFDRHDATTGAREHDTTSTSSMVSGELSAELIDGTDPQLAPPDATSPDVPAAPRASAPLAAASEFDDEPETLAQDPIDPGDRTEPPVRTAPPPERTPAPRLSVPRSAPPELGLEPTAMASPLDIAPAAAASKPASPPAAPPAATKIPLSTAPDSLPPPREQRSLATTGPSPACPQCEAPMAWVEEHLRFYCKSCRMYF